LTVSNTTSVVQYNGNGATVAWPTGFRFFNNTDLVIAKRSVAGVTTILTLNTDYSVTGAKALNGGTVTTTNPLATGELLTIARVLSIQQLTDLRNQGEYFAEIHEDVWDYLTMLIQQTSESDSRALRHPRDSEHYQAEARRIVNLEDPVDAQDAATRGWSLSFLTDLVNSVTGLINNTLGIFYDSGTLYDYLRTGVGRKVDTIAGLRLLVSSRNKRASVLGYYAKGDGGGGEYYVDDADTTSADNGSSIIVATDGARWKLAGTKNLDICQWGADKSGAVDSSPTIRAAMTAGGTVTARDGVYSIVTPIVVDYTGAGFPEATYPSKRLNFLGNSLANTIFKMSPATTLAAGFKFIGDSPISGGQGIHAHDRIGNFSMYPAARNRQGLGIWMLNAAYKNVENFACEYLNTGMELDGVLSSNFTNLSLKNGVIGLTFNQTSLSLPNANTFYSLIAGGNSQAGVIANSMGAGNKFINAKIEQNGTPVGGLPVAGNGGMIVNVSGLNGTACLDLDSCYFEGNSGEADLRIDNIQSLPVTVRISNCSFNRVDAARYTTSNITITSTGGGLVKVILEGNGFFSGPSYTPSATRPFIQYGANVEVIGWDTCVHNENTSIGTSFNSSASAVLCGNVDAAGVILNGPPGVVVTRLSAGKYNVFKSGGWAPTVNGFAASVNCIDPLGVQLLDYCYALDNTTFTIGFRKDKASAFVDSAFSFQVARSQ